MTLYTGGRYPNTGLLLGTLKAADENHIRLCEKSQEVAIKDSVIQDKDSQLQATRSELQAKDSVIQATRSELQAKDSELQRAAFELQWRNLEMRSELEQQFVGQIQQAREVGCLLNDLLHLSMEPFIERRMTIFLCANELVFFLQSSLTPYLSNFPSFYFVCNRNVILF